MRIVLYNILYKCYLILVTLLIARKIKCSAVVLILFLSFASFHENTLHKKSPYSELFWSKFFPHSDWLRRDTKYLPLFSPNAGKYGKYADQNNSEYRHFLCSNTYCFYKGSLLRNDRTSSQLYCITSYEI